MSTLDARKNFAKVQVSGGYDSSSTSITLVSGEGNKLPNPSSDGAFNLVWWNATDYADPSDDPNKEIVRCTARDGDTLTVVRGQEGTSASNKNTAGKIYFMILSLTKKMIDDIENALDGKANTSHTHNASDINAGTLPIARGGTGGSSFTASQLIRTKSDGSALESSGKTVPTGDIVGTSDSQTITNKRNQKRVYSTTSASSLTPEIADYDIFEFTALASNLTINNHSTSTPVNGEMMEFIFKDNGTARTLTWGTYYVNGGVALPTTTTAGKVTRVLVQWHSASSTWQCIEVKIEGSANQNAGAPVNKGQYWVAHGNNVITFPTAHSSNNYRWVVSLVQAPMGGITPRNVPHTLGLSLFVSNESSTRGKVRIEGGYGFTSGGYTGSYVGTTERFDDVANTQITRTNITARSDLAGYSLNGYGFTSCGYSSSAVGTTERFDDVANTHTGRANATARYCPAGYSLNGYGFTSCGYSSSAVGTTERFDDVANTHTGRADATARYYLAGYSLNGYGFTSCGYTGSYVGTTERFDDVANTHTGRADATARSDPAGYSLNEYFVNYLTFNE